MVKTRSKNHKRVFTRFACWRLQTSVEASLEASLKILPPQGAGRPCYEAESIPLAVENSVGKPAANARPMSARERERGELPSPIWSPFGRKTGRGLYVLLSVLRNTRQRRG